MKFVVQVPDDFAADLAAGTLQSTAAADLSATEKHTRATISDTY